MPSPKTPTAVIIGVGPGLGLSVARRFGRGGYRVVLLSRSATRHADYVSALTAESIVAESRAVDVRDQPRLRAILTDIEETADGGIDTLYFGPGGVDPGFHPVPIRDVDSESVRTAMQWVYPAVDTVSTVLPAMLERKRGTVLFASGLSGAQPMPPLGNLALSSAALRNYGLTLNEDLSDMGIYAGVLTIGGLVARGDIFHMVTADPKTYGDVGSMALDPDEIADVAWDMHTTKDRAEEIFSAFAKDRS